MNGCSRVFCDDMVAMSTHDTGNRDGVFESFRFVMSRPIGVPDLDYFDGLGNNVCRI